eukprot:m.244025 g.244025  ORF g.244025 m.244025 type:complete len:163 (-) comp15349_c0_seq1:573-1061(-)
MNIMLSTSIGVYLVLMHARFFCLLLTLRLNLRVLLSFLKPTAVQEVWKLLLEEANVVFVEGFSLAKKVTESGWPRMKLDYEEFLGQVATMTDVRPTKDVVLGYTTAFILGDDAFREWLKTSFKMYPPQRLEKLIQLKYTSSKQSKPMLKYLQSLLSPQPLPS